MWGNLHFIEDWHELVLVCRADEFHKLPCSPQPQRKRERERRERGERERARVSTTAALATIVWKQ